MFFVDRCGICGAQGRSPCVECALRLPPPPRLEVPEGLDDLVALFAYDEGGRSLISALKYHNRRGSLPWIAERLARRLLTCRAELVTWVPASYAGRSRRGFDAGELLARQVARELRLPVRPLLRRATGGVQAGQSRMERLDGPVIRPTSAAQRLRICTVVLIDDVSTTGASLTSAANALRECGIRHVYGGVAARTPLNKAA